MAQSTFTPIILYSSVTASATPSNANLATGELAINAYDGKLYYKSYPSNAVTVIADKNAQGTVTSVAALTLGTTGTDLSSTVATGTTTPVITLNVPSASAANRGALTAADWTTFNAKQPAGSYLTAVTADAPLAGSGTSASHLSIPVATTSVDGYLSSTDWTTFNNKSNTNGTVTSVSVVTANGVSGTVATATTTPAITLSLTTTGTGTTYVVDTSPTLVTPALGTPTALVGTNITGTASGLTAGNVTTNANLTGMVTSVGNAASLGSFTSAQLATALTDETGSGATVFATSPTLVTPLLGTPTSGVLTNCTGLPVVGGGTGVATTTAYGVLAGGTTATGAFQNIGTGTAAQVLTSNGAGALPTFQAASGGVTTFNGSTTGLTPATATSGAITLGGTLAVANGGTGVTTSTGTGATVRGTSPSISGAVMSTMASSVLTSGTSQASTSGTSIDFTGIPSWVKRITVMFQGVSTSGTSNWVVRIGNGSIISSGYSSSSTYFVTAGLNTQSDTSGFLIRVDNASNVISGAMVLYNVSGNTWIETWVGGNGPNTQTHLGGGQLALGGVLDRVRITTVNGTDTFDAGSINIMYE